MAAEDRIKEARHPHHVGEILRRCPTSISSKFRPESGAKAKSAGWRKIHEKVRTELGLKASDCPYTALYPDVKTMMCERYFDLLDIAYAYWRKRNPGKSIADCDYIVDLSFGADFHPWSSNFRSLSTNSKFWNLRLKRLLSALDPLSLMGFPTSQVNMELLQLTITEQQSIAGEIMYGGNVQNILVAFYCNPKGPWHQIDQQNPAWTRSSASWSFGPARRGLGWMNS